jgi:hypothetical protein
VSKLVGRIGYAISLYTIVRLFAISLGCWRFETAEAGLAAGFLMLVGALMITFSAAFDGDRK